MQQVRYPPHIRIARANLNSIKDWQRRHRKICRQCSNAHIVQRPGLSCDYGWQLVKDAHHFVSYLERAGHPELTIPGDQLALF